MAKKTVTVIGKCPLCGDRFSLPSMGVSRFLVYHFQSHGLELHKLFGAVGTSCFCGRKYESIAQTYLCIMNPELFDEHRALYLMRQIGD